jgi:elongation factor Tu
MSFLMPIEDVFKLDIGVSVSGNVLRGSVEVGDNLELIGPRPSMSGKVIQITKSIHEVVPCATTGDGITCTLSNFSKHQISRGQVLATPGSIGSWQSFEAEIRVFREGEFGNLTTGTPFTGGWCFLFIWTTMAWCRIDVLEVMPGSGIRGMIYPKEPLAAELGLTFKIQEHSLHWIAEGLITRLIDGAYFIWSNWCRMYTSCSSATGLSSRIHHEERNSHEALRGSVLLQL